ncbi:MAG TPA: hypothetical protein VGF84_01100, partial [Micromonosporaceae bacterium]
MPNNSADSDATTLENVERPADDLSDAEHVDLVADAEAEAEDLSDDSPILGTPGPPINRRSPFMIGLVGALG